MSPETSRQIANTMLDLLNRYQEALVDRAAFKSIILSGSLHDWKNEYLKKYKSFDELLDRSGFETLRALVGKTEWPVFLDRLQTYLEKLSNDDRIQ